MNFIMNMIKGIFIGIANIIPGVSGGTLAVSMGIYDKLISSVTNVFKQFKKSIIFLFPILIGVAIGIVVFARAIEYLLEVQTLPTCLAFIGLIVGGIPIIAQAMKGKIKETTGSFGFGPMIAFAVLFCLGVGFALLNEGGSASGLTNIGIGQMVVLFFVGIIAAATMVVPGVSGSLVLMILGYYQDILITINTFIDGLRAFDIPVMLSTFKILIPFGIGVVLGIFLIAKIIEILFAKCPVGTYSAILGLIVSAPIAIYLKNKDNLVFSVSGLVIGLVLMVAGAVITSKIGDKEEVSK